MDSNQRQLSAAAWTLLEALSGLRKSVVQEIDFIKSVSPGLSPYRLEEALLEIDDIATGISLFLSRLHDRAAAEMEGEYQALNERFGRLEQTVADLLGR